jgi:hypothetical protein
VVKRSPRDKSQPAAVPPAPHLVRDAICGYVSIMLLLLFFFLALSVYLRVSVLFAAIPSPVALLMRHSATRWRGLRPPPSEENL